LSVLLQNWQESWTANRWSCGILLSSDRSELVRMKSQGIAICPSRSEGIWVPSWRLLILPIIDSDSGVRNGTAFAPKIVVHQREKLPDLLEVDKGQMPLNQKVRWQERFT
jgi:hypothetical protein